MNYALKQVLASVERHRREYLSGDWFRCLHGNTSFYNHLIHVAVYQREELKRQHSLELKDCGSSAPVASASFKHRNGARSEVIHRDDEAYNIIIIRGKTPASRLKARTDLENILGNPPLYVLEEIHQDERGKYELFVVP